MLPWGAPVISLAFLDSPSPEPLKWWDFPRQHRIRIGRAVDNDVVIQDPLVSRYHAELCRINPGGAEDRWQVQNLGKNGTFVNLSRTEMAGLCDRDVIQLASKGPQLRVCFQVWDQRQPGTTAAARLDSAPKTKAPPLGKGNTPCAHAHSTPQDIFCIDCGQPLRCVGTVGSYQLLRALSQGGMGITFMAWNQGEEGERGHHGGGGVPFRSGRGAGDLPGASSSLTYTPWGWSQRPVVLKQMNEEMARSRKARHLFEREAVTLQRLNHGGIPQFLDFFTQDDRLYLVMEMIHGIDLKRYVQKHGVVSPAQVLPWALQVCDVLSYLHDQTPPILHRDVKPANLVLRYWDQRVIVVDFGAVKLLSSDRATRITAGGYTAPEQEEGHPCIQSDQFSLGATLLYLLTGQNPMTLHHYQSADAHYYQGAIPSLSLALAEVLSRLLQPYWPDRYGSIQEVSQALRRCQVAQPLIP